MTAPRPRRSVLYVPADNARALKKLDDIACDVVILDLEDSVAPDAKPAARDAMVAALATRDRRREWVVRINGLATEWGAADLAAAADAAADAILLCKVEGPRDIQDADVALDDMESDPLTRLWAMVETPRAILNLREIVELGRNPGARLGCLVAGLNDLAKDTGVLMTSDRRYMMPWLIHIVTAARASGLDAIDGVMNDLRDARRFEAECAEARNMGFDGKTLIHPTQVEPANRLFAPDAAAVADAQAIVAAFALPENATRGVISLDGRMVERLHLEQARRLLARAGPTVA